MALRTQTGGTLGLVACCCLIMIIVGLGLFFLVQQLGGGREAQHATDAGNLNVAKRALHSPAIAPQGVETTEFGGLFTSDNKVDLESYNKFVGKALIVAMNAAADSNPNSRAHAKAELDMVEGPTGIGSRLCSALKDGNNTKGFFEQVSTGNSLRMVNWRGASANSDSQLDQVSYMRQPKNNGNTKAPANVFLTQSQLPGVPGQAAFMTANFKSPDAKGEKKFFPYGYTPIEIAGLNLFAVPMRPGEQPHLVSQTQFQNEKQSPLANGNSSLVPPNAFMSNSKAKEMHGYDMAARSSAIVGTLAPPAAASIPQGFIVIDNTGALTKSIPAHDTDVFADAIMEGVDVAGSYVTQDHSAFNNIKNVAMGDVPMSYASSLKPPVTSQAALNTLRDQLRNGMGVTTCNSETAFDPMCKDKLDTIKKYMPPSSNPQPDLISNELMAVEFLKWEVVTARIFFTETGCGFIDGAPPPTGLKVWNHNLLTCPIPLFGRPGSLQELLVQSGGAEFHDSIVTRMHQMAPEATDYDSVFNQIVPMGKTSYLYYQDHHFKIAQSMPYTMPNLQAPGINLPDGNPVQRSSLPVFPLELRYINCVGDFGLTHPWDCPNVEDPGVAIDKCKWTPSSGFMNLLGVVKFQNFAHASFKWCCPC